MIEIFHPSIVVIEVFRARQLFAVGLAGVAEAVLVGLAAGVTGFAAGLAVGRLFSPDTALNSLDVVVARTNGFDIAMRSL